MLALYKSACKLGRFKVKTSGNMDEKENEYVLRLLKIAGIESIPSTLHTFEDVCRYVFLKIDKLPSEQQKKSLIETLKLENENLKKEIQKWKDI